MVRTIPGLVANSTIPPFWPLVPRRWLGETEQDSTVELRVAASGRHRTKTPLSRNGPRQEYYGRKTGLQSAVLDFSTPLRPDIRRVWNTNRRVYFELLQSKNYHECIGSKAVHKRKEWHEIANSGMHRTVDGKGICDRHK